MVKIYKFFFFRFASGYVFLVGSSEMGVSVAGHGGNSHDGGFQLGNPVDSWINNE
jgi:hypothetical protein